MRRKAGTVKGLSRPSILLVSIFLGSCGLLQDELRLEPRTKDLIAQCGAGIELDQKIKTKVGLSAETGIGIEIADRASIRAAFLSISDGSSQPDRVVAYTQYIACVTNQEQRELALSEILERKIVFLRHMDEIGLPKRAIVEVRNLYNAQYEETRDGNAAEANKKLGAIITTYFSAVQTTGTQIQDIYMPPPAPGGGSVSSNESQLPPDPETVRQMEIERAKYKLRRIAFRGEAGLSGINAATENCVSFYGSNLCRSALMAAGIVED